jgi:hypothetical protein
MPSWIKLALLAAVAASGIVRLDAPAAAAEDVDLLLVLAADVSRSVDEQKFRLQREGYAAAIVNRRVIQAIQSGPHGRIAVSYVEWAGPQAQTTIVDWTIIAGPGDAEVVATRVLEAHRSFMDRTSISGAIDYALQRFAQSPYRAARRIIDISGDGINNSGGDLLEARERALSQGVTINGLVILSELPLSINPNHTHPPGGLQSYYERNVIGGPGAFVIAAEGFDAFGQSIVSKLVKEIAELSGPLRQ